MVVDSSALVAILFDEPDSQDYLACLEHAPRRYMSSFSWLETSVVVAAKKGKAGTKALHRLIALLPIEIIAFDATQAEIALDAWQSFGKGRHKAGLNLGDCAAYALSRTLNQPLLFKGDDFPYTDLAPALV